MAEISSQIQDKSKEREEDGSIYGNSLGMKIQKENEVYGIEDKPTTGEFVTWYFYGFCSYFVLTVLVPIVFPLIISQTVPDLPEPPQGWLKSFKDLKCPQNEMQIYVGLVYRDIRIGGRSFSPLEWTSISWITGTLLATPILGFTSFNLDYGHGQQLVAAAATGIGALFCLPAGFFRKSGVFLLYLAVIVATITITGAWSGRHLGLLIRGFTGPKIPKSQFASRRAIGSKLSLYSTAAGYFGAVIMASFTYHMLSHSDHFTALWVVSIFSGLLWGLGLIHIFSAIRGSGDCADSLEDSGPVAHILSIFRSPLAAASLALNCLASFMTMCIFASTMLYALGYLCMKTHNILFLWLIYFMVPLASLPLAHRLQQIMKLDSEKMQLVAFILSTLTSGCGIYYRQSTWSTSLVFLFSAIQGTAAGLLHSFGAVLLLDCTPAGKEGVFSSWSSWARVVGACAGFAWATSMPGNIGKAFGVSLCAGMIALVVLIFGNISSLRGAKAAGHIIKRRKVADHFKGSDTTEVTNDV